MFGIRTTIFFAFFFLISGFDAVLIIKLPECRTETLLLRESHKIDSVESVNIQFPNCLALFQNSVQYFDFSELSAIEVFSFTVNFLLSMPLSSKIQFSDRLFQLMTLGNRDLIPIFVNLLKSVSKVSFESFHEARSRYNLLLNEQSYFSDSECKAAMILINAVISRNDIVLSYSKRKVPAPKKFETSASFSSKIVASSRDGLLKKTNSSPNFYDSTIKRINSGYFKLEPLSPAELVANSISQSSKSSSQRFFSNPIHRNKDPSKEKFPSITKTGSAYERIFREKCLSQDKSDSNVIMRNCLFISKFSITSLEVEDHYENLSDFATEYFKMKLFT